MNGSSGKFPLIKIEANSDIAAATMTDKEGSGKSFLYQDFDARRNIYEKVITTPHWFDIEEYAFAWSTSIRNHNFLFTNTEQIEKNKEKARVSLFKLDFLNKNFNLVKFII